MRVWFYKTYLAIDILILIVAAYVATRSWNVYKLPVIGYLLAPVSVYMLFKCRKNRLLSYMMVVIATVNISISANDFIRLGEGISAWQSARMRMTSTNVLMAQCLFLFTAVFNLFLNGDLCEEQDDIAEIYDARMQQNIVAYACFAVLAAILAYGVISEVRTRTVSEYASVSTPIYEYSVLLYILAWLTAKDNKWLNVFLDIYALAFIGIFLFIGDRSSASMYMIFLLVTKYKGKVSFSRLIGVAVGGLLVFNSIAIFRTSGLTDLGTFFQALLERGLYTDTASWAYYTSITVVAAARSFNQPMVLHLGFLKSLIGFSNAYASLQVFARNYRPYLYFNRGGSIFPAYFMAWMGFGGVVLGGIIVGLIIRRLFSSSVSGIRLYYKFLLIVFVIRWYVYSPTNMFRSIFVLGTVLYLGYTLCARALFKDTYDERAGTA